MLLVEDARGGATAGLAGDWVGDRRVPAVPGRAGDLALALAEMPRPGDGLPTTRVSATLATIAGATGDASDPRGPPIAALSPRTVTGDAGAGAARDVLGREGTTGTAERGLDDRVGAARAEFGLRAVPFEASSVPAPTAGPWPVVCHLSLCARITSFAVLDSFANALAAMHASEAAATPAGPPSLTSLSDCRMVCAVSTSRSASSTASPRPSSLDCGISTMWRAARVNLGVFRGTNSDEVACAWGNGLGARTKRTMWGALREGSGDGSPRVSIQSLVTLLSRLDDLRVPASVARAGGGQTEEQKRLYLEDLVRRDVSLFLERHGHHLGAEHLALFHHLRGDYEVNFHLERLTAAVCPSPAQLSAQHSRASNRRLAQMRRLESEGYFHEDNMRRREPLLYETYVGAPLVEPIRCGDAGEDGDGAACLAGGVSHAVSMAMLEKEDERAAAERLSTQRKELAAREEMDEADGDGGDEGAPRGGSAGAPGVVPALGPGMRVAGGRATAEELSRARLEGWGGGPRRGDDADEEIRPDADIEREAREEDDRREVIGAETDPDRDAQLSEFGRVMRERFLRGKDGEHVDYAAMDADQSLDDTWRKEAAQDAEDAYFDAPSPAPSEE